MLIERRAKYKKYAASVSFIALTSVFSMNNAVAATNDALVLTPGTTITVDGTDTIDMATQAGSGDVILDFVEGPVTLTASGAGSTTVGIITVANGTSTNTLKIGNGTGVSNFTVNNIAGNNAFNSRDLSLTLDADNDNAGTAGADVNLYITGDVDTDTKIVVLDDDATSGNTTIILSGSVAQTAKMRLSGASAGEGQLVVTNTHASGVTFTQPMGTLSNTFKSVFIGNKTANTGSVATFSSSTSVAQTITIGVDGDDTGATTSSATFNGTTIATSGIIFGEAASGTDTVDTNTLTFSSASSSYSVTGVISAADAADTNIFRVGSTGTGVITFINNISGVDSFTVGSTTGANTIAKFRGNITSSAGITLGATGGTDTITATFEADNSSDRTIIGAISGAEAQDTINLSVLEITGSAAPGLVTFSNAVGGSSAVTQIDTLTVGSTTLAGRATFSSTFYGNTINITGGDNANEDTTAAFTGDITGGAITTSAASAGDANVIFTGNVTTTSTTLNKNSTGTTTAIYNGSSAQTIVGTISGESANEGTVKITNSHASGATFSSILGGTTLGTLQIGDVANALGGTATFSAAVTTKALTMSTAGAVINDDVNATFNSLVTITDNTTLAAGDAASEDVNAIFNAGLAITGGTLTLDDGTSGALVTTTFGGSTNYTVATAITGAAAGEGSVVINNTHASGAVFSGAVGGSGATKLLALNIGAADGANSIAIFNTNVGATAITLGNGGVTADTDTAKFVVGAASTITGTVNGSSVDTSNLVIYSSANNISHTTTFSNAIGGINSISNLTIGDATAQRGGKGIFDSTVISSSITITAADTNDSIAAMGDFNGAVSTTTLTLTAGGNDAEDASATFAAGLTATSIILNDEDATGDATTTITFDGAVAQAIAGSINGAADNEGKVVVTNSHASGATFSSILGGTTLGALQIGDVANALGGTATFSAAVTTKALTMSTAGAVINDDVNATFNGLVTITDNTTLSAGDVASEDVNATFNAGLSVTGGTLTLDDGTSGALITTTFGGSTNYTVATVISGAASGEGSVVINNTHASGAIFSGAIGGSGGTKLLALNIGTTDGANSIATFKSNVGATAITLGNGGGSADINTAKFVVGAASTITGTVNGSSVDTSNLVIYSSANNISHTTTFSNALGGINSISNLTVGDATAQRGGKGIFDSTVAVSFINITAADTNDSIAAIGDFNNAVSTTTLTLTAGGNDAEDASATFAGGLTATSIILNDEDLSGDATTTITMDGAIAQTISGIINGAADNEGKVSILNTTSTGATFSSIIGGTHAIATLSVGDSGAPNLGGYAVFNAAITAANIYVDAADTGDSTASTADFNANVTGSVTLMGGDAAIEDATATFAGNLSGVLTLDDGAAGSTVAIFDGSLSQTINSAIAGASTNEGKVSVLNTISTGATFSSIIGGTHAIGTLSVGDSSTPNLGGYAVFNAAVTAANIYIDASDTGDATASTADFNAHVTGAVTLMGGDAAIEDATATFAGNLIGALILNDGAAGSATVTFDGSSVQAMNGEIMGASVGEGTLNINNDIIFSSNVGATRLHALTLSSDKTMTIGVEDSITTLGATTATINGSFKPLDTIELASDTTLVFATGSQIIIEDISVLSTGEAFIDADTNDAAVTIIGATTLLLPLTFTSGSFVLVDAGSGGTLNYTGTVTITGSLITNYVLTNSGGVLTVAVEEEEEEDGASGSDPSIIASTLNVNLDEAAAFGSLITATSDDSAIVNAISIALAAGGSEAKKVAVQAANPATALSASSIVTAGVSTVLLNISSSHMSLSRLNIGNTGIATGDDFALGQKVWVQPFYNKNSQELHRGVAGYDATTTGTVIGLDVLKNDNITTGLSFSYAKSEVDGNSLSREETQIDSYQISLYGEYYTDIGYVQGLASYTRNEIETLRHIDFGGLNRIAEGSYNGDQYATKIGAGLPIKVNHFLTFTPTTSIAYTHVSNNPYLETGAGDFNLIVMPGKMDILMGILGGNVSGKFTNGAATWIPEMHGNILYNFGDRKLYSTSSYTGGGAAFSVSGADTMPMSANFGAGIAYKMNSIEVSLGYDTEVKKNFVSHTGILKAKYQF